MSTYEADGSICQRISATDTYFEQNSTFYTQLYPADSQQSDTGRQLLAEEGYFGCSSDDSRNEIECTQSASTVHQSITQHNKYDPVYYSQTYEKTDQTIFDDGYYGTLTTNIATVPFVRVFKRRSTANKKERRRTQSINSAFSYLRECIPNVPSDTKLSKIKTLRLATSYISYLTEVLKGHQDPSCGFRAELVPSSRKINAERRAKNEAKISLATEIVEHKRNKGRTGWPQHVWASELKQE